MKYVLTAALIVVASGLPVTAADKTVRLYPTPLPASQMLIDLSGKLVKAQVCQKKVAQCVAYVRRIDPTFDAYMNPLIRAFGTTQGAFEFDKCMHRAGVETRLIASRGGVWDEYVPPRTGQNEAKP